MSKQLVISPIPFSPADDAKTTSQCSVRYASLGIVFMSLVLAVGILAAGVDILRQTSQVPFETIAGSLETFQISLRTFVVGGSYILFVKTLI